MRTAQTEAGVLSPLPAVSRWSSRPSHVLAAALGGLVVTTFPISVFSLALPQLVFDLIEILPDDTRSLLVGNHFAQPVTIFYTLIPAIALIPQSTFV